MSSDPYIGDIMLFAGNYAPEGWSFCSGQIIPISENPALYAVIGTTYGGNGTSTFALPDLRGRAAMGLGQGPGLQYLRKPGQAIGASQVQLSLDTMPAHDHGMTSPTEYACEAMQTTGTTPEPGPSVGLAQSFNTTFGAQVKWYAPSLTAPAPLGGISTALNPPGNQCGPTGNDGGHENRQPWTGLSFVIATEGAFPPRDN